MNTLPQSADSESELTVLIATNRVDDHLRQAIKSLFESQGVTFDVVLVFDGVAETDLSEFTNDQRITCLELETNRGLGGALHAGMSLVNSEFVARLDADDMVSPLRLKKQLAYLKAHPDVVNVSCQITYIDVDGKPTGESNLPSGADIRQELLLANVVSGAGSMFRKTAHDAAGGFNPLMRYMEDYDMWLRMANHGPIAVLDEPLYYYRFVPGSLSSTIRPWGYAAQQILQDKSDLATTLEVSPEKRKQAISGWLKQQRRSLLNRKIERAVQKSPRWLRAIGRPFFKQGS